MFTIVRDDVFKRIEIHKDQCPYAVIRFQGTSWEEDKIEAERVAVVLSAAMNGKS